MPKLLRIGTAGLPIPRQLANCFCTDGSNLARYASCFSAAEINSTFHRSHKTQTWTRWAAAVPDDFRFAVKVPKRISHGLRLVGAEEPISTFADETRHLGAKLGPLLLQLPPSLSYDRGTAESFLKLLREHITNAVVCEPRHPTWFEGEADRLLAAYAIARVAADPARVPAAGRPGGFLRLSYYRLHGAPRLYYSSYDAAFMCTLVAAMCASVSEEVWCIFDNTASGAATTNALSLQKAAGTTGVGPARILLP
jgi:uncharacterized protein YecE (DUF72 family)